MSIKYILAISLTTLFLIGCSIKTPKKPIEFQEIETYKSPNTCAPFCKTSN